jgi:hypothetical protein
MKQKNRINFLLIPIIIFLAVPSLFSQVWGNGNVVKQERSVGDFTGVVVRSGIDLLIKQGDQTNVVIETDENLQEYIITEVESGILYASEKENTRIFKSTNKDAHVTVRTLKKLKVSGGGDASILVAEELILNAGGGSQTYLSGDPYIDANLTGGSKVHRR